MNFEVLVKYLIWIAFTILALGGIYFMLKSLGII